MSQKFIQIDQEGYFILADGLRFNDESKGHQWLSNLKINEWGVVSTNEGHESIIVEPFDKPYVAAQVEYSGTWNLLLPYQVKISFEPKTLLVDEWDRFHGLASNGIPFVLTNKAQAELFNLADGFTDDSITLKDETIHTENFYIESPVLGGSKFWDEKYQENSSPPWDLQTHHPALESSLPQLKLLKGRFAVLGSGTGYDAAFIASAGHITTGFDISPPAIDFANSKFANKSNLQFLRKDIFTLSDEYKSSFDYIFEHTCFCAIQPSQRKTLVRTWKSLLTDEGHFLGIFFVQPKRSGPPFGASEFEILKLLESDFRILYWTRAKIAPDWRLGTELIVYAQKNSGAKS